MERTSSELGKLTVVIASAEAADTETVEGVTRTLVVLFSSSSSVRGSRVALRQYWPGGVKRAGILKEDAFTKGPGSMGGSWTNAPRKRPVATGELSFERKYQ